MSKLKSLYTISSYGLYKHWDEKSKELPKIVEFTTEVSAKEDIEFGFILNAKKAKGKKLTYTIYHPDIPDENNNIMAPFSGDIYVRTNNWDFYLGDSIWLPLENKTGIWHMTITDNDNVIAEKKFNVFIERPNDENQFWKKRGY